MTAEEMAEEAVEPDEHVAEVHPFTVVSDDAHEEEERAPIALGPVHEAEDATDVEENRRGASGRGGRRGRQEVAEVAEVAEVEDTEETEEADEDDLDVVAEAHEAEEADESDEPADEAADEAVDEAGDESHDELAPVLATLPLHPSVRFEAPEAQDANGNGNGHANGHEAPVEEANPFANLANRASLVQPSLGQGPLERRAQTPASMEDDETPIFRSLRSNWLTADTGERPWADSEVDAGWDAADRVEATPPTRHTEAGLPMRRPGNRLIPGGISAPTTHTVRDPEAIRARLAAHAAGVSRGRRTAATSEVLTDTTTQEVDPA